MLLRFDASGRPGPGGLLIGLIFAGLLALIGLARVAVGETEPVAPAVPTPLSWPASSPAGANPDPAVRHAALAPAAVRSPEPMVAEAPPATNPDDRAELARLQALADEQREEIAELQRSVSRLKLQLEGHQLEAEIRESLATDFHDLFTGDAAPRLTDELTDILLAAARRLAPADAPPDNAEPGKPSEPRTDWSALRRVIPDGVVRQLGYALPRLLQERDLAPGIVHWAACGQGTSRTGTEIVSKAIVDGQVTIVDRQSIRDVEDPRVAQAEAEQQRRESAWHGAVEAILGFSIYGDDG